MKLFRTSESATVFKTDNQNDYFFQLKIREIEGKGRDICLLLPSQSSSIHGFYSVSLIKFNCSFFFVDFDFSETKCLDRLVLVVAYMKFIL